MVGVMVCPLNDNVITGIVHVVASVCEWPAVTTARRKEPKIHIVAAVRLRKCPLQQITHIFETRRVPRCIPHCPSGAPSTLSLQS